MLIAALTFVVTSALLAETNVPILTPVVTPAFPQEPGGLAELAAHEVIELHRFLEDWSNATIENGDDIYRRFADALADDFVLIGPQGGRDERSAIVRALRGAHGRWVGQGGGRIEIRDLEVRVVAEPLALVSYQEWHHLEGEARGRYSSALFRRESGAPGGVAWVHLHEVWLPDGSAGSR